MPGTTRKAEVTILTDTTPEHGLSRAYLESVRNFAKDSPVLISVGEPVDWSQESIGHVRLTSLSKVRTEYLMFLDSDDVLLTPLPTHLPEANGFIYNFVSDGSSPFVELKTNKMDMFATCRTVLKTEFVRSVLEEFVRCNGVREDVWLMARLLQSGDFYFVPKYLTLKHKGRCARCAHFVERSVEEYRTRWDSEITWEFLKGINETRESRLLWV